MGQGDPLDEATHSSIFAWRILWTEEPGRLQSIESQPDAIEATEHSAHSQLTKREIEAHGGELL